MAAKKARAKKSAKKTATRRAKKVAKKSALQRAKKAARPAARASDDAMIPEIIVHDGPAALDFYKRAFGATEVSRMMTPEGKLMHGELRVLGHRFFVCDEFSHEEGGTCRSPRTLGGTGVRITVEVADAGVVAERAIAAGATSLMAVQDMFWGGRYGKLLDPFGHEWGINQQKVTLTAAQEKKAADAFLAKRA